MTAVTVSESCWSDMSNHGLSKGPRLDPTPGLSNGISGAEVCLYHYLHSTLTFTIMCVHCQIFLYHTYLMSSANKIYHLFYQKNYLLNITPTVSYM